MKRKRRDAEGEAGLTWKHSALERLATPRASRDCSVALGRLRAVSSSFPAAALRATCDAMSASKEA